MKIEVRDNGVTLEGYVNAVQRDSRMLPSPRGKFVEQIVPKTFEKALSNGRNVDLLFNHREDRKLGSTSEGSLQLHEDNIGLRAKVSISDPEVITKARNGELRGWSFGFIAKSDRWEETNGIQRRFIEAMDLLEVSILDKMPAYIGTSIEERDEETLIYERRNEQFVATIEDFTKQEEDEQRELDPIDYSIYENEITYLKLKQRGC